MAFKTSDVESLLAATQRRCCLCGVLHNVQVHHIVPKAEGGTDDIENAITLCPSCHDRVHVRPSDGRITRDYTPEELRLHRDRAISASRERSPVDHAIFEGRWNMWRLTIEAQMQELDSTVIARLTDALREISGDARLSVVRITRGSVVLELAVSPEASELLERLVAQGLLKDILGYKIVRFTRSERRTKGTETVEALAKPHLDAGKSKIRVLFLAANPIDTRRLQLDEEIRAIGEKIRLAEFRDNLSVSERWATRPDDLLQALNENKPHIVHFSGHGSPSGDIRLADAQGKEKPVSQEALTALFKTLREGVRLVVLNACYSDAQARAITEVVDCTVGMSRSVSDRAATVFAASFYRAICFGCSVGNAFQQGVVALQLEGIGETETLRLHAKKGVDPDKVILVS